MWILCQGMKFDLNVFSSRDGSILICEVDLFVWWRNSRTLVVFASASPLHPLQREAASDENYATAVTRPAPLPRSDWLLGVSERGVARVVLYVLYGLRPPAGGRWKGACRLFSFINPWGERLLRHVKIPPSPLRRHMCLLCWGLSASSAKAAASTNKIQNKNNQ